MGVSAGKRPTPMRQIWRVEKGGFLAHRSLSRSPPDVFHDPAGSFTCPDFCLIFAGRKTSLGRQEAAGWRDEASRDLGRGQGPAPRGQRTEGGRRRTDARKPSAQKKRDRGWGRRGMRYSASEKAEIIRLVGQSALPVKRTLEKLGTRAT